MQLNNCVPKFPGLAWRRLQNAGPPEPGGSGFPPSDFDQKYCSIKTLHYCVHIQIFIPSTGTEMHCTVKLKEILKNSIWWYVTEFQAKTYLNIAKPGDPTSTIIFFKLPLLLYAIARMLLELISGSYLRRQLLITSKNLSENLSNQNKLFWLGVTYFSWY